MNTARNEPFLYFIKKGIVRAFVPDISGEKTFWFGIEGEVVLSMRSYVYGKPSYENIELLEPCELYRISIPALQQMYEEDNALANWGRKLAEQELIKVEERLISAQTKNATERYRQLMDNTPHLLQRVPLGYIASYLGITQASLSRIRAERK